MGIYEELQARGLIAHLTATAVPAGIVKLKLQEVAKQHLNVVLVVQLLERVIENLFVQMLEPLIEIIQPQYVHYL